MIPGQIVLLPPNARGLVKWILLFIESGVRHQRLLAGVSSFDLLSTFRHPLFIAGQKPTHTSNCGVVSAS